MSTQALSAPICSLSLLLVQTQAARWKAATPEQLTGAHLYLDIAKSGYLFHAVWNVMNIVVADGLVPTWHQAISNHHAEYALFVLNIIQTSQTRGSIIQGTCAATQPSPHVPSKPISTDIFQILRKPKSENNDVISMWHHDSQITSQDGWVVYKYLRTEPLHQAGRPDKSPWGTNMFLDQN